MNPTVKTNTRDVLPMYRDKLSTWFGNVLRTNLGLELLAFLRERNEMLLTFRCDIEFSITLPVTVQLSSRRLAQLMRSICTELHPEI